MRNSEVVAWLDGYLKGLTTPHATPSMRSSGVLMMPLSAMKPIESYLAFINSGGDTELADAERLTLNNVTLVSDLYQSLSANIDRVCQEYSEDKRWRIMHNVMDMIDAIVPYSAQQTAVRCDAKMQGFVGEYLFIKLPNNQYLIIGFLY